MIDALWSQSPAAVLLAATSLVLGAARLSRGRVPVPGHLGYLWAFLLVASVADLASFTAAVWVMALISFRALREYFSLVDMRLEDRWGILVAYLAIPFMIYLVQIHWYGFFIVSIPVYAFVVVPFLVTLGDREGRGSLLSIGAIDFGLFFFVYCLGHLAYLAYYSTRLLLLLLVAVAGCDLVTTLTTGAHRLLRLVPAVGVTTVLTCGLSAWAEVPAGHALALGVLIPVLVAMSDYTVAVLERDLGISAVDREPGSGLILDSLKSYLFAAPIVFHYLRWFLDLGHGD